MNAQAEDSPTSAKSYEAMRQRWLGGQDEALGSSRAGLAVLLRQGVAAWVGAWALPLQRAAASSGPAPKSLDATRGGTLLPEPSRAQMSTVLATMVWAAAQGATR